MRKLKVELTRGTCKGVLEEITVPKYLIIFDYLTLLFMIHSSVIISFSCLI